MRHARCDRRPDTLCHLLRFCLERFQIGAVVNSLVLRWESVNFRDRSLEIIEQKNGEKYTIPPNSAVVDALRSIPLRLHSDYVLTGLVQAEPFHDLKRQSMQAVAKSKLEGVHLHTLRRTVASHLVMAEVDLATGARDPPAQVN